MAEKVRIAVDAMGGDVGPAMTIAGCALAAAQNNDVAFLLFGDQELIARELAQHPVLKDISTVFHTDVAIQMGDKPSQALRNGRKVSSMWQAIDAVKQGNADVAVSAGNTGALMAMAKVILRTLASVERPALAGIWPNARGESIVLDLGASIGADAQHLVDLAIMGSAMARIVLGRDVPTVGLLNVGVEEIKGIEEVKAAARILRQMPERYMKYHGFVEGDDLGAGTVDVVVTEGFTGNIALKTAEGTAKQIAQYLRQEMNRSVMSKIGYLCARAAFKALRMKMDPRRSNGAVFLGLDGIVIKSHGGTDGLGFSGAVDIGYDMARNGLQTKIREALVEFHEMRLTLDQPATATPEA
ncbi:MAG: phosphate acyltransferase PlsX [Hyphomicrobiales bacterium]|nr:phosphate acyltransferase PlsX [Hyphomicrobiales bacterium]